MFWIVNGAGACTVYVKVRWTSHPCTSRRLLLLEEHRLRLLVHPVLEWDDRLLRPRAGDNADHDARQPQGGHRLRVLLQPSRLWPQKADTVHRLHADQRDVLYSLNVFFIIHFICERRRPGCVVVCTFWGCWGGKSIFFSLSWMNFFSCVLSCAEKPLHTARLSMWRRSCSKLYCSCQSFEKDMERTFPLRL